MNTTDQTTHLFTTLPALLAHQASACADSPAIEAPGREALTYQGLWEHVASIGDNLKTAGVCPTDRIALLLPNGPEMAVAFLAASGVACAAPLNPAYRSRELEFYFTDLHPKVLLVDSRLDTPARKLAHDRGITVIELTPCEDAAAGIFTLSIPENITSGENADDSHQEIREASTALILHT